MHLERQFSASMIVILTTFMTASSAQEPQMNKETMLHYLVQASRSHIESYNFLECRFSLTTAFVQNVEDGIQARWLANPEPIECHVRWAFDGEAVRRDEEYDPEVTRKTERREGRFVVKNHVSRQNVWSRNVHLRYEPGQDFQIAQSGEFPVDGWNPINVGMGAVFHRRVEAIAGLTSGNVRYVGNREESGEIYPIVETRQQTGTELQLDRYWLDENHGYLPRRIETFVGNMDRMRMLTVVSEYHEIGEGRWLPQRAVYMNLAAEPIRCIQFIMLAAKTDPAQPDIFQLAIPANSRGYNRITKQIVTTPTGRLSAKALQPDGSVSPAQPDILVVTPNRVAPAPGSTDEPKEEPSTMPTWPFASRTSTRSYSIWGGLGVIAIGAIFIALYKSKKKEGARRTL